MPELPDIEVYVEALTRVLGDTIVTDVRLNSPFVLRSVAVRPDALVGQRVTGVARMGKRIVFEFTGDLFVIMHLMVAGRLRWAVRAEKLARTVLCSFDFGKQGLQLTEVSKKKRASLHIVRGRSELAEHERHGLEVLHATAADFTEVLRRENHTLKRALTDPRLFSGIGNAYSDEILHRARMSPMKLTRRLTDGEAEALFVATRDTLHLWLTRLRAESRDHFPTKVTAFRPDMAVHGKYRQPCPVCGQPVQRIVHAENETNYCAQCQTGGRLLADRAISRLLKDDWPRSLDELETLPGTLLR